MTQILLFLVAAAAFGYAQWRFGVWRLQKDLDAKSRPLDDPGLVEAVRRLGETVELPELRAHLYDMPAVNGLATPDGRIFITDALYQKYRLGALKAEEVASVIAHELGHVALGHHRRRLIDWTGQNAARMALGMILGRFIPVVGHYVANFLASLLMAGLSRRDEFEADRYATALMLKSGFGHEPQVAMFRKLRRMVPGPKGAAWLASHPDVEDRIAAIERNVEAWGAAG